MPAGDAFSERDLRDIGTEVRAVSAAAKVIFSVLVADPAELVEPADDSTDDGAEAAPAPALQDVRAYAEQAHAAIGDRADEAVLIMVAPNARRVEIVMGTALRGRLTDRDCALAALSMTSSFAGGDLTGGILNGVRMLGQRVGAPRRAPSTVSPGRPLSALIKP